MKLLVRSSVAAIHYDDICPAGQRRPSLVRAAGFMALAVSLAVPAAGSAAAGSRPQTYKVGHRLLTGRAKSICVIEGRWSNGAPLRYEAWDSCGKLTLKPANVANYKGWAARGRKGSLTVADIPRGSEVIEISNGVSSVLVFRDYNGETKDVLIRD